MEPSPDHIIPTSSIRKLCYCSKETDMSGYIEHRNGREGTTNLERGQIRSPTKPLPRLPLSVGSDICRRLTVEIRHANKDDLERLVDVFRNQDLKTSREESQWFISCYFEYHHIVVAEVDGRVQGACVWRIEGERYSGLGWIENIWVEEKSRRKGLAEKLLRRSIEDMKIHFIDHGIKLRKVVLITQVDRSSARNLYEKIGFKAVARLDEMYDPGGQDLVYVLDVKS